MSERLLALLRVVLAPEKVPAPLDWTALAEDTRLLSLQSMLYSSVRRAGRLGELPVELRVELQRAHATTTAHNLELASDVRELTSALAEAGVSWVPLKGAALLELDVYRDFGARPTSDIDIVTDPVDRGRVEAALRALGYRQHSHGGAKHLPPFERGNMLVEVHESAFWQLPGGEPKRREEMGDASGRPRLEHTVTHLVHHALVSSVPTPTLLVKTLCDLDEVRLRVEGNEPMTLAIGGAAASAGLRSELCAFASALALVLDEVPPRGPLREWVDDDWRERGRSLLDQCAPLELADADALRATARTRAILRQPWRITVSFLRTRLLPPRAAMEGEYRLNPGSPLVIGAYAVHIGKLVARIAGDVVRLRRMKERNRSVPGPPATRIR